MVELRRLICTTTEIIVKSHEISLENSLVNLSQNDRIILSRVIKNIVDCIFDKFVDEKEHSQ